MSAKRDEAASIFSDRFEFPDGFVNTRCEKPEGQLLPSKQWGMDLPDDIGRATLAIYVSPPDRLFSRAVHMASGETAWFRVERISERAS